MPDPNPNPAQPEDECPRWLARELGELMPGTICKRCGSGVRVCRCPSVHDPLRFRLLRQKDEVAVADGVQFADGTVVLRWRGEHPSIQTYSDWGHAMRIHHIGEPNSGERWTTAQWLDGICFACGNDASDAIYGGNGGQCLACSSGWHGPPNRYLGEHPTSWKKVATLPARTDE